MALLSACWLIIESIVIQDGFLKWFYMKLYMQPLVLFLCQLLIWLYLFILWLLSFFQAFYNAFSSILFTFSKLFSSFLRVIMVRREVTTCDHIESRKEIKNSLNNLELSRSTHNPIPAFSFSFKNQVDSLLKVHLALQEVKILEEEDVDDFFSEFDQEDVVVELLDAKEDEEGENIDIVDAVHMEDNLEFETQTMPIDQEDESSFTNDDEEEEEEKNTVNSDVENDLSSLVSSDRDHSSPLSDNASLDSALQDSIVMENQTHQLVEDDHETDQVYKKYCEKMRWYDILGRDRTYGLSAITNQVSASGLSLWGKTAEKRLKQSIKKDLELVYVAQSCLSWEALQHQYIIVRDHYSKSPDSRRGLCDDDDISREFQNFQVLLERFLEDERCVGKRVLSFVQRRFEFMNFFQVPRLSGSYNREEREKEREEKQVLKILEKCIEVFYDFVKVDDIKKPLIWERLINISFVNSPLMELEDPRDFKLFLDLKKSLQKKEQLLKEMQGNKKKFWFKKSSNMGGDKIEKDEHFMLVRFVMIDLKLVSRVLHMSLVSSSHLKWCQQKLNNIHFNGDKIYRTVSPVLFPS